MKTPELIIVEVMVVGHIDTTYVTYSLHKGLILCKTVGKLNLVAYSQVKLVGRDNLTTI